MKYLLDTHVVLWCALSPQKLSQNAKEIILDINTDKYVSIVSVWEFTVKHSLNKLDLAGGVGGFFQILDENGFALLGIENEYMYQLAQLPLIHHDPFDRMLIAAALAEEMCLVTADDNIRKYDVPTLW
jgi:PIN domain nuclease of toxin-antitoxin system